MDYSDLCGREGSRLIRMADGRTGRIVSWYHTTQSVGVQLSTGTVVVHCSRVQLDGSELTEVG